MSKTIYDKLNLINQETDKIKTMLVNSKQLTAEEATLENLPPAIQAIIEAGGGSVEANPYEELYMQRTNNATNMAYLFAYCNAKSLDISSLDTSNTTSMSYMFYSCSDLTSIDLSNWDTSNATDMQSMFYYCSNLTSIDLSSFNTSNVTKMSYMFNQCKSLTTLDLNHFDVSKVTSFSSAFNCPALTDFKSPKNINAAIDFSKCTNLTHDSLMSIINNLATVTSTKKLTLGTTNLAKLTDEEKAIATNRGWTLA